MIPYVEDFLTKDFSDGILEFTRTQPHVRPLTVPWGQPKRRLSFPGYGPVLEGFKHQASEYGESTDIDTAPPLYRELASRITEYAAATGMPSPINYLSTIGYLTDDRMKFHQHKEDLVMPEANQAVYVVSFGAVHPVAIRSGYTGPKRNGKKGTEFIPDGKDDYIIYPKHGSLYVLPGSFNRPGSGDEHEHAVLAGTDYSYGGLRIAVNCKCIPEDLTPEQHARATSRPAGGLGKTRKTGASSPSSPRVCWGKKADFPDAVYVGMKNSRGKFEYEYTPFGNFKKLNTTTVPTFREYAVDRMRNAEFRSYVEKLRGKDLLCPWCSPGEKDCHALVWLELANMPSKKNNLTGRCDKCRRRIGEDQGLCKSCESRSPSPVKSFVGRGYAAKRRKEALQDKRAAEEAAARRAETAAIVESIPEDERLAIAMTPPEQYHLIK
jgi:hypothetical protein